MLVVVHTGRGDKGGGRVPEGFPEKVVGGVGQNRGNRKSHSCVAAGERLVQVASLKGAEVAGIGTAVGALSSKKYFQGNRQATGVPRCFSCVQS